MSPEAIDAEKTITAVCSFEVQLLIEHFLTVADVQPELSALDARCQSADKKGYFFNVSQYFAIIANRQQD